MPAAEPQDYRPGDAATYAVDMTRFRLVGGLHDGEIVEDLPDGYVRLGTGSVASGDPNEEIPETAEYEG